jgi:hypothetical protein
MILPMRTIGFSPNRPAPTTRDLVAASLLLCPGKAADAPHRPLTWDR